MSTQTNTGNVTAVPDAKIGVQAPPKYIRPNFDRMPADLKLLKIWLLWVPIWKGTKWTKRPIQVSGFGASTTNSRHWSSFDQVKQAYECAAERGYMELCEKDKSIKQIPVGGVGFVFDGRQDEDGLVFAGADFDKVISDETALSFAQERIKRLGSYVEASVSGTGVHVIVKARPLPAGVAHGGVELYTSGRFFTMTGRASENARIVAAPNAFAALAEEVRVNEAAAKQQSGRSGSKDASNIELPPSFGNGHVQGFATLDPRESLAEGIKATQWFEALSPEQKDEVVDCALWFIAKNTRLLELEADGGNNAEYYKLTTSVTRSGAPNAENIFVKHASTAKTPDPEATLRQHFSRCLASKPSGKQITVGSLLRLAQQNGANFDQWRSQAQPSPATATTPGPAPGPVTWSAAGLKVPFSKIRHHYCPVKRMRRG